MEPWKERFLTEYKELKTRFLKLREMLVRYETGTLDFEPTCPINLLKEQAEVMYKYMYSLEIRAMIEKIDLT